MRGLVRSFLCLFLLAAPAAARAGNADERQPVIRLARDPEPAPAFSVVGLDGQPVALEAQRGKVVLLNFWATWCKPCRAEIPDLIALQNGYAGKLQIIGLSLDDESPETVQEFVRETGINYPVAMATAKIRALYGGVPALPTSFLVDTQGRVVQKHTGLRDPALYETEIRALLGLPIDARIETFEDKGEIFLRNASRATELPGVDLSRLTPEQKQAALRRFNAESCTCPCELTLAQCRVNDSECPVSAEIIEKIVSQIRRKAAPAAKPAPGSTARKTKT
ncbi:MAG: TlpA family protein disulfide reductase [Acidobacteriia bacterium]|nr:TlpA family protein disulfide reductase [Terriglobia bacterium]